jgi:5-formyltetrahydrofolate cyclo-ligase
LSDVLASKASFRKKWKAEYPRDPAVRAGISQAIVRHILAQKKFHEATHVGLFAPREWEVDLLPLWSARPKNTAFPTVVNDHLAFFPVATLNDLKVGYSGILEPPAEGTAWKWEKGDVILTPGSYFDWSGGRIGWGKGFYDKFLASNPAEKWGIAMEAQVSKVPLVQIPTDVRMLAIITETGFHPVGK